MEKKKIIISLIAMAVVSGLVASVPMAVIGGAGNAAVINATPVLNAVTIVDGSWTATNTILPNVPMYCNVTASDPDGYADIEEVTVEIVYSGNFGLDDPSSYYNFTYNSTTTIWNQVLPSTGTYLTVVSSSSTALSVNAINFSFAFTLNKTAQDTNGLANWHTKAYIVDKSVTTVTIAQDNLIMAPFVEYSYWGNAGGTDFLWTGTAESNQTVSFSTLVTSNDQYEMNCSYTGFFDAGANAWGDPTIWIKQNAQTGYVQIVNASAAPGTNVTWFTSVAGQFYWANQTHQISLEFPAGISKDVTYTGVTIWIQAKNN